METDKGISDTHEMVGGGVIEGSKRENVVFSFVKNNDNNEKTSLLIGEAKTFEAYGGVNPYATEANNIQLKGVTFYKREKEDKYTVVTDTKIQNITVTQDSIGSKAYRKSGLRFAYEKLASGVSSASSKERNQDKSKSRTEKTAKEIYDDKDDVAYLVINDTEGKHVYCAVIPYENNFIVQGNYSGIILPGGDKNILDLSDKMLKRINDIVKP